MKIKEILELLKKNYDKFSAIEAEKKQDTIEKLHEHKNSEFLYREYSEKVTQAFCDKYGLEKVIGALSDDDKQSLSNFYIKGLKHLIKGDDELRDQIVDLVSKTEDENLANKFEEFLNNLPKEKHDRLVALREQVIPGRLLSMCSRLDYQSLENVYKKASGGSLDEIDIEFDENEFVDIFENPSFADEHPYSEKINEIIKGLDPEKDALKIEALKQANEYIISGKAKYYEHTSQIAESYGANCDRIQSNISDKGVEDLGIGGKIVQNTMAETDNKEIEKILNDKLDPDYQIDPEIKKEILSTSKFIKENGILQEGEAVGEEGGKIYSMRALVTKADELKKAIDENRLDDVVKLTEEYKKLDEAYTTITDKLKDTSKYMFGNISSSRVASVPSKYRNNYLGVSKLTSVWMLNKMCESSGIKIEEFMDKPFESIKKIGEKSLEKYDAEAYNPGKKLDEVIDDILKKSASSKYELAKREFPCLSTLMQRSVGAIQYFSKDEANSAISAQLGISLAAFLGTANNLTNDRDIKGRIVENFIFSESKDRNLITMSTDVNAKYLGEKFSPFDKEAYLKSGKTTVDAIISRMNDLKKNPDKKYEPYIKNVANYLKTLDVEKTPAQNKYLDAISKGARLYSGDIKAIETKAALANELKENDLHSLKDLSETVKGLASMKRDYESRNFFKKLLGSGTRRLKSEIDSLENTISEKTMLTKEEIQTATTNVARDEAYDLSQVKFEALRAATKQSTLDNVSRFQIEVNSDVEFDNPKDTKEEEYEMFLEGLDTVNDAKNEKDIQ